MRRHLEPAFVWIEQTRLLQRTFRNCLILTSKERRTIMIAKALGTNDLTANDRERVVLLAAY